MIRISNSLFRPSLLSIAVLVASVVAGACGNQDKDVPLIFAAASLAEVLTEAAETYETETGNRVEFNFGGSTALANQVARLNAPADGVILAGERPIAVVVSGGKVRAVDVRMIASNSLVVVSADTTALSSLDALVSSGSLLAIADPDLAPAGEYAQEALVSAGIWSNLEDQVVPTLDVRAALAAASSESVGFAIVYSTDARTEPDLNVVLAVDSTLHQPVTYPAAAIADSSVREATEAFLDFLASSVGQGILREHGFITG